MGVKEGRLLVLPGRARTNLAKKRFSQNGSQLSAPARYQKKKVWTAAEFAVRPSPSFAREQRAEGADFSKK